MSTLSKSLDERIKELMEAKEKAAEMVIKVRNIFPEAKKVKYSIDEDHGNERVYYDFDSINDHNIRYTDAETDEVGALIDELNDFIWDVASFDQVLHEQGFSFDFDTFEVTIIKYFKGHPIKPIDHVEGFSVKIKRPWWFPMLDPGYYIVNGERFGLDDLNFPEQSVLFPTGEIGELRQLLIERMDK